MSSIFEALQRSEVEHSGGSSLPTEATGLLQRAELRATATWDAHARSNAASMMFPPPVTDEQGGVSDHLRNLPTLKVSPACENRLVSVMNKQSPAAEAFRLLGVRLRHMQHRRTLKRLLITSTVPKEGKSTVAANLACALAGSTEQKILLLEGDLRRPSLMQMFGLGALPGLCECLQDNHALATSIYCLESMGLWLLPAGSAPGNALDILQSERLSELMGQLSDWFDWIIIDSPPVLPLADASVWARLADGVVLVTRKGVTEKQQLQRGLSALDSQKLVGVLLNCSTTASHSDYYYRPPAKHHAGSQL